MTIHDVDRVKIRNLQAELSELNQLYIEKEKETRAKLQEKLQEELVEELKPLDKKISAKREELEKLTAELEDKY